MIVHPVNKIVQTWKMRHKTKAGEVLSSWPAIPDSHAGVLPAVELALHLRFLVHEEFDPRENVITKGLYCLMK
jgi:hypothetical protein